MKGKLESLRFRLKDIFIFTLIFLLTFLVFYFINKEISKKMEILKQETMEYLESQIGRKISYDSISPSIFMYLEIRNLKIYNFDNYDEYLIKINKIRINYNIFSLIINEDPVSAVSEINISNSQFYVDWERDREIIELVQSIDIFNPDDNYNIKLSGSNLDFYFSQNDYACDLNNIFFNIKNDEDFITFNLEKADIIFYLKEDNDSYNKQFESQIKTSGKIDANFRWVDLQLSISDLSTDYFIISDQTFQVLYKTNEIRVTKIKDKAPVDINMVYNLEGMEFWVDFKAEDFILSDEIIFKNDLEFINDWIPESMTSNGNIYFSSEENIFEYNVNINANINNSIIPSKLYISSSIYGDQEKINFMPLYVSSNEGDAKFSGNFIFNNFSPDGTLYLYDIECPSGCKLNAVFDISRNNRYSVFNSNNITVGMMEFNYFNLSILPENNKFQFFLNSEIKSSFVNNRITAKGNLDLSESETSNLVLDLDLKNLPVIQVFTIFSPVNPEIMVDTEGLSSLALNSEIRLKTDFDYLDISSTFLKIRDYNNPNNYIISSFSLTKEYFKIPDLQAVYNDNTIHGYMNADFTVNSLSGRDQVDIETEIVVNRNPYYFEIQSVAGYGIIFKGPYNLSGSIQNSLDRLLFTIKTEKFLIPLNDNQFYTSMDISGYLSRDQKVFIDSSTFSFYNLPFINSKESMLFINFSSESNNFNIENIKYSDNISKLNGSGIAVFNSVNEYSCSINLSDAEENELYYWEFSVSDQNIDFLLDFRNLPVSRFGSNIFSGGATGVFSIKNTFDEPSYDLNLTINNGRFLSDPVAVTLKASFNNKNFNLDYLNGHYLNHNFKNTTAWYNNKTGNFSLKTTYDSEYFTNTIETDVIINGAVSDKNASDFTEKNNLLQKNDITANIRFTNNLINDIETDDLAISLYTDDDKLFIKEDRDNSINGFIAHDNSFEFEFLYPLPLTCTAHGIINENNIDAEINNLNFNAELLNSLIGKEVVAFENGSFSGYISISGLINDPDFNGKLNTEDVVVSFYLSPDMTDNFSSTLVFQEKTLRMDLIQTKAGDASVFAEGNFIFSHWVITEYDLDFWTDNTAGIHIIHDFGSVFVDGYAIGKLNLIGDAYSIDITSDILINHCKITLSDEIKEADYNYEDIPYLLNLNIKSGKNVDFLWPTFRFPIFRTNVKLGSELVLDYNDIMQELNVEGDVELISGDVFYFNRNFYIRNGKISFNEHTQQIDPRITIEAEIRERDQNNEEVKIFLIVNNKKLSEFEPEFRSEPAMSYIEITSILGSPLQQQFSENAGISALLLSSDFVSQFGIIRPFEQKIRETFNLDLFSIRTQVIQSVLFRRFLEENGASGNDDSFGEYLNNTTITVGKYLGEDIFLEAYVNLKKELNQEINTEFYLSVEFPTPIFDIEWALSPKFNSENELYPIENSITLSWDLSF